MLQAAALAFPSIDPILFQIGPFAVRWYALAYVAGILLGWWYAMKLNDQTAPPAVSHKAMDDVVVWAIFGVILGGRLGYVLFYKPEYYFFHPLEIPQMWHGGMSFHGGMLGVIFSLWLFSRKHGITYFRLMDIAAAGVPFGLFFGRIANFINDELWGRVSDVPWAVMFPRGDYLPRHPSQLYEAFLEGVVLFCVLYYFTHFTKVREKAGILSGIFLMGYGIARFLVEYVREPDDYLGYLFGVITMGQLLCLPMIAIGAGLVIAARKREGGLQ